MGICDGLTFCQENDFAAGILQEAEHFLQDGWFYVEPREKPPPTPSEGNPSEYDSIYGREGPVSHIRVKVGIAGQNEFAVNQSEPPASLRPVDRLVVYIGFLHFVLL